MIKALITDVSKVLLFPKDKEYQGSLNALYKEKASLPNFAFFDFFELNNELLEFYKSLKPNLSIYILTSDAIQDAPELQPFWKDTIARIFSASQMNTHKSNPEAYKKVLSELNLQASEAIYIDDSEENLKASKEMGLTSILYQNNNQVILSIKDIIKNETI
jgi:FMN phosphatase YigB (HAD superfamily)